MLKPKSKLKRVYKVSVPTYKSYKRYDFYKAKKVVHSEHFCVTKVGGSPQLPDWDNNKFCHPILPNVRRNQEHLCKDPFDPLLNGEPIPIKMLETPKPFKTKL